MEQFYNIVIRTDGRPALSDTEITRAINEAINQKDPEAEHYGAPLVGYSVTVNSRKMF